MKLVEGLHWVEDPDTLSFVLLRINYYHPQLADIVWCLLFLTLPLVCLSVSV
jgi:hypothetical protein